MNDPVLQNQPDTAQEEALDAIYAELALHDVANMQYEEVEEIITRYLTIPEGKELQIGVKALATDSNGDYLLLAKNRENSTDYRGSLEMLGGRMQKGSSVIENLGREIGEETDKQVRLISDDIDLIGVQAITHLQGRTIVRLTFSARISDADPKLSDEHVDFQRVSPIELKELKNLDIYLKQLVDRMG